MSGEDSAAARASADCDDGIDRRVDLLEGERGDDLLVLEGEIAIVSEMLERAAAAFTIMRATLANAVGTGRYDVDDAGAVAVNFGGDRLAGQGERRKHLPAIMRGDAVALRAKTFDGEGDGASGHGRLEAGSAAERQPSPAARNRNLFATITVLSHGEAHDMVPPC